MDGMVGWDSAPPGRDTGVKLVGTGFGFALGQSHSACEIPSGVKSLLKPPLHPFPEEMLRDRGHTGVFRGVFHALRWRWRYPEPTQASSPARKTGKSWEFNLPSTPCLGKNQRKICFTKQNSSLERH